MRRGKKFLLYSGLGILGLIVVLLIVLSTFDWNRAKPWIADKVSEATGRSFVIRGDLKLSWERPQRLQSRWRRIVPWPHLRAHDLELGNPEWAKTGPTMMRVPQVDFTLNPFAFLQKTVSISSLVLTEPNLVLEVGSEGDNNWTFKQRPKPTSKSPWKMVLHEFTLNEGNLRFFDPVKKADVTARIDTLDDGSVVWKLGGKFDKETVSGGGKAGELLSLRGDDIKYPVEAHLKIGDTDISAKGTLTDPKRLSALDINLKILGASMAHLFPFSGIVLPETPKFSTEGRVVGTIARDNFRLRYENFKGRVGTSDIGGTLEYLRQSPRPLLRGAVVSNHLNLKDLGAMFSGKDDESNTTKQPPDKVLPVAPFRTERWDKIDVQVDFTGKEIIRSENLPVDNLFTRIHLENGALKLAPLNFGVAGGKFATELIIDGKAKPAKARFKVAARGLRLDKLFPAVEAMKASIGQVHANAELTAVGNSFSALAASANGEVKALISEGTVSKFILEAIGLNVGSIIVTKIFGDKQVELNCMATDFNVRNGLMKTQVFVIDTKDALIGVDGHINLAKEEIALTIRPDSKGIRIISLRSPLYVRGTFKKPDVGIDTGVVAAKAGAAIALGTLATPIAALLALINPGPEKDSPCAALLAEAKKKPVAPAPGKPAKPEPKKAAAPAPTRPSAEAVAPPVSSPG